MERDKNTEINCPNCGKVNVKGDKVCFKCGYTFTEKPQELSELTENKQSIPSFSVCCVSCVLIVLFMVSIGIFLEFGVIQGLIGLLVIGIGIFLIILYIKSLTPEEVKSEISL